MATEIFAQSALIPAGTLPSAPVVMDVSIPPLKTERVEWFVPKGAAGLMGWRLTSGGAQVLPKNLGAWMIIAGESGSWELENLHDSGKWEVTAYNTGAFAHTVYVRFHAAPVKTPATWPKPPLLSIYTLTSAADLTAAPPEAFASDHPIVQVPYYQVPRLWQS